LGPDGKKETTTGAGYPTKKGDIYKNVGKAHGRANKKSAKVRFRREEQPIHPKINWRGFLPDVH
jgi:hypothetical protein